MRILIVGGLALSLGACATVVRGTAEQVAFQSDPPGAEVRTSNGLGCPETPCAFQVPRKDQFVATFSKPGYRPEQVVVGVSMGGAGAAGMVGNVVAGGIVGAVVDASSGAAMDHTPNPVIAELQPLRPVSPVIEQRRPRRRMPVAPSSDAAQPES